MADEPVSNEEGPSPKIQVFYSSTCPSCIKKLGLKLDGITQKNETNLTKALELLARCGFDVTRYNIMEETNKAMLLCSVGRGDIFLPVILSASALLENPPIRSITDLIDAVLGLKILPPEEGHEKAQ